MPHNVKPAGSREHQVAHATFVLVGDAVLPNFWTNYFGVAPDGPRTKGEPYLYPSGKLSDHVAKLGYWGVESKSAVRSDQLEPHLRYLIKVLQLPRDDLRELVSQDGVRMSIWCFWYNETGDRVPDVPDDIRAMIESLGGTVEIDEYR